MNATREERGLSPSEGGGLKKGGLTVYLSHCYWKDHAQTSTTHTHIHTHTNRKHFCRAANRFSFGWGKTSTAHTACVFPLPLLFPSSCFSVVLSILSHHPITLPRFLRFSSFSVFTPPLNFSISLCHFFFPSSSLFNLPFLTSSSPQKTSLLLLLLLSRRGDWIRVMHACCVPHPWPPPNTHTPTPTQLTAATNPKTPTRFVVSSAATGLRRKTGSGWCSHTPLGMTATNAGHWSVPLPSPFDPSKLKQLDDTIIF